MDELVFHLRKVGLDDTTFWLSQLEKLGVQSITSLSLLYGDMSSISHLEAAARYPVEEKAIHKLLEKKENAKESREERRERNRKHKEELHIQGKKISKQMQAKDHGLSENTLKN